MKQTIITLTLTLILAALAACTTESGTGTLPDGTEPGTGTLPVTTRVDGQAAADYTYHEGTLTLTVGSQTAKYNYQPADGNWTLADDSSPIRLPHGTHPATATASMKAQYSSIGPGTGGEGVITLPMTWTNPDGSPTHLQVAHTPGDNEARLTSPIALTPNNAALHITLLGSYNEPLNANGQPAITTGTYPDASFRIDPTPNVAHDADTWTYGAPGWLYPWQPLSPAVFKPQTIAAGQKLLTIKVSGKDYTVADQCPYYDQTFTLVLPADLTLLAGHKHKLTARLDPGSGRAILESIDIEPFAPGPDDELITNPGGIYTAAQLARFAKEWNELAYDDDDEKREVLLARWADADGIIRLKADIDMAGISNFMPIGCPLGTGPYSRQFDATFHGGGYTISNLKTDGGVQNAGLFGMIAPTGRVYALHIRQAEITGTIRAGGIAGSTFPGSLIAGCSFGGELTTGSDAGGIVGYCNGTVAGCYAGITAISGGNYRGGIAGTLYGSLYGSYWKAPVPLPYAGGEGTEANCSQIPTADPFTTAHTDVLNEALRDHASGEPHFGTYSWLALKDLVLGGWKP